MTEVVFQLLLEFRLSKNFLFRMQWNFCHRCYDILPLKLNVNTYGISEYLSE